MWGLWLTSCYCEWLPLEFCYVHKSLSVTQFFVLRLCITAASDSFVSKKWLWWFHCNVSSDSERRKIFRNQASYISMQVPLLNTISVRSVWWNNTCYITTRGHVVAELVETMCYKPEGRGFDSRLLIGILQLHNPPCRTMALSLNQPLTEMSTRNISWG